MQRRCFLAASAATLAMPAAVKAQSQRVLKFLTQSDLAIVDPIWTTAYVTRNHGFMVFDTLYGQTGQSGGYKATPQMVAGHVIEDDGKIWKLTLRDGLLFHDGEKVLARLCLLDQALGRARCLRPSVDGAHRRTCRGRRQDRCIPSEATLRPAA